MRKPVLITLLAIMTLSIAACGENSGSSSAPQSAESAAAPQSISLESYKACLADVPYITAAQLLLDPAQASPAGPVVIQALIPVGIDNANQAEQVASQIISLPATNSPNTPSTLGIGLPANANLLYFKKDPQGNRFASGGGSLASSDDQLDAIINTIQQTGVSWNPATIVIAPSTEKAQEIFEDIRIAGTEYLPSKGSYGNGLDEPVTVVRAHNIVAMTRFAESIPYQSVPCLHKDAAKAFSTSTDDGVDEISGNELQAFRLPKADSNPSREGIGALDGDITKAVQCIQDTNTDIQVLAFGGSDDNGDWPGGRVTMSTAEAIAGELGQEDGEDRAKQREQAMLRLEQLGRFRGSYTVKQFRAGSILAQPGDDAVGDLETCLGVSLRKPLT